MEKNIKLKMEEDKMIRIFVNDNEKYIISSTDRSITAEKIYEIFEFSIGDHYSVSSENNENIEKPVLDFFVGLFSEIVNKINSLYPCEKEN